MPRVRTDAEMDAARTDAEMGHGAALWEQLLKDIKENGSPPEEDDEGTARLWGALTLCSQTKKCDDPTASLHTAFLLSVLLVCSSSNKMSALDLI